MTASVVLQEFALTEKLIGQLTPLVQDQALLSFAVSEDSRQLVQNHPKLNQIFEALLSVLRSQGVCLDRLWQQSGDTSAKLLTQLETEQSLSFQVAELRTELASEKTARLRRKGGALSRALAEDDSKDSPNSPSYPVIGAPPQEGVHSIQRSDSDVSEEEVRRRPRQPLLDGTTTTSAIIPEVEEKLNGLSNKVEAYRQKINEDFDHLVLDVNAAAEVTCKDVNEELRRIHKTYSDWAASEKRQLEQTLSEMKAMLLEHIQAQKEILEKQQEKLTVMAHSHNKLRAEVNELRAIVLVEQGKTLLRDSQGVASVTDLANKVDRFEFDKVAEEQGGLVAQLRDQVEAMQEKANAMSEILAITSGGKVLSEAIHTRFANISNELYRLEKNKAERVELLELRRDLTENPTIASVKCLSCNRTAGPVKDHCDNAPADLSEFPPSTLCMTSWNSPGCCSPEQGYAKVKAIQGPAVRRKGVVPPSPGCDFTVARDPPPRKKLHNFYDWIKTRSEEESARRLEITAPPKAPTEASRKESSAAVSAAVSGGDKSKADQKVGNLEGKGSSARKEGSAGGSSCVVGSERRTSSGVVTTRRKRAVGEEQPCQLQKKESSVSSLRVQIPEADHKMSGPLPDPNGTQPDVGQPLEHNVIAAAGDQADNDPTFGSFPMAPSVTESSDARGQGSSAVAQWAATAPALTS